MAAMMIKIVKQFFLNHTGHTVIEALYDWLIYFTVFTNVPI